MTIDQEHIKNKKITSIEDQFVAGVYAWQMPDGKVLGQNGDMLNVPSMRGDVVKMNAIRTYVNKELGITAGEPVFLPGVTRITDDEHDEQMSQLLDGQVPDMDLGSMLDDLRRAKLEGRL